MIVLFWEKADYDYDNDNDNDNENLGIWKFKKLCLMHS